MGEVKDQTMLIQWNHHWPFGPLPSVMYVQVLKNLKLLLQWYSHGPQFLYFTPKCMVCVLTSLISNSSAHLCILLIVASLYTLNSAHLCMVHLCNCAHTFVYWWSCTYIPPWLAGPPVCRCLPFLVVASSECSGTLKGRTWLGALVGRLSSFGGHLMYDSGTP